MTTLPTTAGGERIARHALLEPAGLPARHVDVWLPPGYSADEARRFPVIYMHDGQNLFDPAAAYGGEVWGVGEALARLMAEEGLTGALIVGVWNSPGRWPEYMPARPLRAPEGAALRARFVAQAGAEPVSDAYVRFLADELKPLVDSTYRTRPEQDSTFVMGSSMGGLISLYALTERPELFGGAACLSTHWPIGGDALVDGLAAALPPPGRHRLYFDYGTVGLDADYEPFQLRMDRHLRAVGYREGRDFHSQGFPGADHNEAAWRERVHLPLRFLLAPLGQGSSST
ncbi:MAG TPA: alpha/beta hydrolase-fold protein [Chloroflexaceae bacterium]|nr:alpha/beta hydrolase-fold protein [Chloroflexaceae bacterium]